MNLGIALFCTGKYVMFLDQYIKTCEENYLPNTNKKYYIFTDSEVKLENNINYEHIFQEKLGWPLDTLKRYEIINKYKDRFSDMDYISVTNANVIFPVKVYEDEVLPTAEGGWMSTIAHPWWYDKTDNTQYPFERNPVSTAYVAPGEGQMYYQACFIVGRNQEFFKLASFVEEQSNIDMEKNFIAIYWDESYINRYWVNNPPTKLSPAYCHPDPEVYNIGLTPKIIQLEKGRYGGHGYLREA